MDSDGVISLFLQAKTDRGLSKRTLDGYRRRLRRFAERYPVLPTTPEVLEGYCAEFKNPETRDTEWRSIVTLYRWLLKRRLLAPEDNPLPYTERPRMPRRIPRAFTEDELHALFNFPHPPVIRVFMVLMLRTGIRLGEAWSLKPESLRDNTIIVDGKTGPREIPCDKDLISALKFILPWQWSTDTGASHAVRKAMLKAGLKGRRASAHTLRHTFARRYKGDIFNLSGILWGHMSKQIDRYRPFDVDMALDEYERQEWVA